MKASVQGQSVAEKKQWVASVVIFVYLYRSKYICSSA